MMWKEAHIEEEERNLEKYQTRRINDELDVKLLEIITGILSENGDQVNTLPDTNH